MCFEIKGRGPKARVLCVPKSKVEGRRPECFVFQNQRLRAEGPNVVCFKINGRGPKARVLCFKIKGRGPKARVLCASKSKVEGRRPECCVFHDQR